MMWIVSQVFLSERPNLLGFWFNFNQEWNFLDKIKLFYRLCISETKWANLTKQTLCSCSFLISVWISDDTDYVPIG